MARFACIAAIFGLAATAWAQEPARRAARPSGPPARSRSIPFPRIELGAAFTSWMSDFSFEARSATEGVEFDQASLEGFDVTGKWEFSRTWAAQVGVELAWGVDMQAIGGSLSGLYRPKLIAGPWETTFKAGVLYATLDADGALGNFDPGFGIEGGAGLGYRFSPSGRGPKVEAGLAVRQLEFDFDKDPAVTRSDDGVGGFGVRFLLGFTYRF